MSLKDWVTTELAPVKESELALLRLVKTQQEEHEAKEKASRLSGFRFWAESQVEKHIKECISRQFFSASTAGVFEAKVTLVGSNVYSGARGRGENTQDPFEDYECHSILKECVAAYLTREASSYTPIRVWITDHESDWDPDWGGFSWREMHATSTVTL